MVCPQRDALTTTKNVGSTLAGVRAGSDRRGEPTCSSQWHRATVAEWAHRARLVVMICLPVLALLGVVSDHNLVRHNDANNWVLSIAGRSSLTKTRVAEVPAAGVNTTASTAGYTDGKAVLEATVSVHQGLRLSSP